MRRAHLVAKTLRGNDGDLIADTLVGLEVEGELGVVTPAHRKRFMLAVPCYHHSSCLHTGKHDEKVRRILNDDLGGLLDRLRSYATHDCGCVMCITLS